MIVFIKLQEAFLICAIITGTIGVDYCTIESCAKGEHTLCKYPTEKIACADGDGAGLTEELKKVILDHHNVLRQNVAKGKQSPQPEASNMVQLTWDNELEKIAQRWANQCIFGHDSCKNTENSTVGQNIASLSINITSPNITEAVLKMIDNWYDEVKKFNKINVKKYKSSSATGHYSQMNWAQTEAIGCGFIQLDNENKHHRKSELVCNYMPAGNVIGQPMYKIGTACSECANGFKCSEKYPGLCSKSG